MRSVTSVLVEVVHSPRHTVLPASLLIHLYSRQFRAWPNASPLDVGNNRKYEAGT